jgi:regulator of RNase E activity RraA
MDNSEIARRFITLTTPHLADACMRANVPVRCAPSALRSAHAHGHLAGRVVPAQHSGSVDIFLEAINTSVHGDVLVVDNGGRTDEACVGDLVIHEAHAAGLGGVVIWGLNRDSADIAAIGLALFSLGTTPTGPLGLRARTDDALDWGNVGEWRVGRDDLVFGDDDGVLFVPAHRIDEIFSLAESIRDTERHQADLIRSGTTLRAQLHFDEYLAKREDNPALGLREHLRSVGGEIEV